MNAKQLKKLEPLLKGDPEWELDVVCGMDVDPRTTRHHYVYKGKYYHFCNTSCLQHFIDKPERYVG